MTPEQQHPPRLAYCARCQREHHVWPREYFIAKFQEAMGANVVRWIDAQLIQLLGARGAPSPPLDAAHPLPVERTTLAECPSRIPCHRETGPVAAPDPDQDSA